MHRTVVGALVASASLIVGGSAVAAGGPDREARCEARLGARIDAAEKAGRIGPERAERMRERVESVCGSRPHARIAAFGMLKAAAEFLGLDRAELRAQLPGTSLAALAEKQGKSAASLRAAMVAPAKARLAKAVVGGKLTQARADLAAERLDRLAARLAARVFPTT